MGKAIIFDAPASAGIRNQVATARVLREAGAEVAFCNSFELPRLLALAGPDFDFSAFTVHALGDFPEEDGFAFPERADSDGGEALAALLPEYNREVFRALRKSYEEAMRRTASFLSAVQPSAIFVADDGVACNAILMTLAKARGVPIFCSPYGHGVYQNLENAIALTAGLGEGYSIASPGGDLVAERFPKWLKTGNYAGSLLMPPEVILARESVGATIEAPWQVFGSDADVFCAPGEQYRDMVVAQGYSASRVAITGSATGMLIDRVLQKQETVGAAYRQPVKIEAGKTRVLVAFPPSYHRERGHLTEFSESYLQLVDNVTRPLRNRPGVEMTLSAHPATTPADLACYDRLGIELDGRYLLELIPQHDIFLTDFSSTISWAVACGKPVVNYDFYGFALDCFAAAGGVLTMTGHSDYLDVLHRLIDDDQYFAEIASRQIAVAEYWGRVDQRFAHEVLALIDQWHARHPPTPPAAGPPYRRTNSTRAFIERVIRYAWPHRLRRP
jgi:hypothetical protein